MTKKLNKRRYASGRRAMSVSDRSGQVFKYVEMVSEPGTELWVHQSESDGIFNVADYSDLLNIPAGDAQNLEEARDYVIDEEIEQWFIDEGSL